jgi:hypothetical protein
LTLPIPLGLACGTLNLTVLEGEFRMAIVVGCSRAHSKAGKSGVANTASNVGM